MCCVYDLGTPVCCSALVAANDPHEEDGEGLWAGSDHRRGVGLKLPQDAPSHYRPMRSDKRRLSRMGGDRMEFSNSGEVTKASTVDSHRRDKAPSEGSSNRHFAHHRGSHAHRNHRAEAGGKVENENSFSSHHKHCEVHRKYIPSPHEKVEFDLAYWLQNMTDVEVRWTNLTWLIASDDMMENSTKWLNRLAEHMKSSEHLLANDIDEEFLSKFRVTATCPDGETDEWDEYIEPLTIHARHPLGFSTCKHTSMYYGRSQRRGRSNVDYVLLQSGYHLDRHRSHARAMHKHARNFLLDAGTSTFDSSLIWFTCGYAQRGISFDQVFGWEYTLLEPRHYWSRVPEKWKPFWHFYNVPISGNQSEPNSVVNFIKTVAKPEDFVSFKLDIDNPSVEMPIAMDILNDGTVTELIDEFFFELHYRCDIMMYCGWGNRIPEQLHGLKLDRPRVLEFFQDLRKKGIRAHIWP